MALRGLARHSRAYHRRRVTGDRHRCCVAKLRSRGRPVGTCVWCGYPSSRGRWWHDGCLAVYLLARCDTKDLRRRPCVICGGPGEELDHRLALAIARELSWRLYVRAFLERNCRWTCTIHHTIKTREDAGKLAAIRRDRRDRAA